MTTDPQTTRYRHRTTDVEAVQWTGNNTDQLRAFCGRDFDGMDPMEPGDWVVKTDEDFLVFSPVDFATYYEPAVSAVPAVVAAVAGEVEAHPPTHTWKVESPRRDQWASWGATHDERVWAAASYDDVIEVAPQRAFRLVRATTTYAVEAEHTPTAVSRPGKEN